MPPHVSVYMLEVDEDSRLGSRDPGWAASATARRDVPSDDLIADLYEIAVERLAAHGHPPLRDFELRAARR